MSFLRPHRRMNRCFTDVKKVVNCRPKPTTVKDVVLAQRPVEHETIISFLNNVLKIMKNVCVSHTVI